MSDGTALTAPDLDGEARAQAIAAMAQRLASVRLRMRRGAVETGMSDPVTPEPVVAEPVVLAPGGAGRGDAPDGLMSMRFVDEPAEAPDPYVERVFSPAVDAEAAWPRAAEPGRARVKLDLSPWKEELAWAGRIALMGAMGVCGFGIVVLAEDAANGPHKAKHDVAAVQAAPVVAGSVPSPVAVPAPLAAVPARQDLAQADQAPSVAAVDAPAPKQWQPAVAQNMNIAPHAAPVHRVTVQHAAVKLAAAKPVAVKPVAAKTAVVKVADVARPRAVHAAPVAVARVAVARVESKPVASPRVASASFDLPRWVTEPQESKAVARPREEAVQTAMVMSPPPHDLSSPPAPAPAPVAANNEVRIQAAPVAAAPPREPTEMSASAYPVRPPFDPPAPFRYAEPPGGSPYYGYTYGGYGPPPSYP